MKKHPAKKHRNIGGIFLVKTKHLKEAEFHADAVAYDILLKLIMDEQCGDLIIEEYTYLAPMMYMDFFSLYYYTDYILYGTVYNSQTHPMPDKRKAELFTIVKQDMYQLNTEEDNAVYQWFCWIYDKLKFNEELKVFMEGQAVELGLDKRSGASLVDQYIEIYPDELPVMGMFDLNEKDSVSVKPGNVLVHQKKYLIFALGDWAASWILPKTILSHIQLCLTYVIWLMYHNLIQCKVFLYFRAGKALK